MSQSQGTMRVYMCAYTFSIFIALMCMLFSVNVSVSLIKIEKMLHSLFIFLKFAHHPSFFFPYFPSLITSSYFTLPPPTFLLAVHPQECKAVLPALKPVPTLLLTKSFNKSAKVYYVSKQHLSNHCASGFYKGQNITDA